MENIITRYVKLSTKWNHETDDDKTHIQSFSYIYIYAELLTLKNQLQILRCEHNIAKYHVQYESLWNKIGVIEFE